MRWTTASPEPTPIPRDFAEKRGAARTLDGEAARANDPKSILGHRLRSHLRNAFLARRVE
jgi:hypothetical protein